MILSPTMMMQIMPLVGQFAGAVIGGKKGKRIAKQSAALGGLLGMAGNISKAFASPSTGTGLGIADSKSEEAFKQNPEGIFGGVLGGGATFGEGINKLPESLGGVFKSPGWNASESIFAPPGEEIPFDWGLFR